MKIQKTFFGLLTLLLLLPLATAELSITDIEFQKGSSEFINEGTLSFTVTNNGPTVENGILELAFRSTSSFSFFGVQDACDPSFPYNVHKVYSLPISGSERMTLTASGIPQGSYDILLTHATMCCTDGSNSYACESKQPFGFESVVGQVTYGNPAANDDDQCDTDFQALQYLHGEGQLSCVDATCLDAATSSSTAQCTRFGVCNSGALQTVPCSDGSEAVVRSCIDGAWQETRQTCPDGYVPDEPPSVNEEGIGPGWFALAAFIVVGLVLYFVFKK